MEKEKVTTRLDAPLRRRLKVYAAAAGLTVEDVVSTALEGYLSAVPAELDIRGHADLARATLQEADRVLGLLPGGHTPSGEGVGE